MTTLRGADRAGIGVRDRPDGGARRRPGRRSVVVGEAHARRAANSATTSAIGPYCRVRPNTVLASGVELGTHAEVKNSTIGAGTRISHFSSVLDSDVGTAVNIGAGTVTCNYDGEAKYRTTIGDRRLRRDQLDAGGAADHRRWRIHRSRLVRRSRRARRRARGRPEPAAEHRGLGGAPSRPGHDRELEPVRRAAPALGQREPGAQRAHRPRDRREARRCRHHPLRRR